MTLDDYRHCDDDYLLTEEEVISIVMDELAVSRKEAKHILDAHVYSGKLQWVLAS